MDIFDVLQIVFGSINLCSALLLFNFDYRDGWWHSFFGWLLYLVVVITNII